MTSHVTRFAVALTLLSPTSALAQAAAADRHPLDPLTREEIAAAVATLKATGKVGPDARFGMIALHEPPKQLVLSYRPGSVVPREAFAVVYDYAANRTSEAVVDVVKKSVVSWTAIPSVQPNAIKYDDTLATRAVRADSGWRVAMRKRGANPDTVRAGAYPIGPFAPPGVEGRLVISRTAGVIAFVNLTTGKVVELVDQGPPVARTRRRFNQDSLPAPRPTPTPLRISQPQGPGFTLRGHEAKWENWRFRFGMHPREGLVLYQVSYEEQGRPRSVLYRAALSELFVPYGDLGEGRFHLTAFDAGEAGLGVYGDPTMSPSDCPENAVWAGAVMHDYSGAPRGIDRAVCLYERDGGVLWRHGLETRRARQLVLSSIVRIDNYDYGFNWVFGLDGTLEHEVLLTGLMNTRPVPVRRVAAAGGAHGGYGALVDAHTEAMNHQHLFSFRLDLDVDGTANTVVESNTEAPAVGPENPNGNVGVVRETVLRREGDARRLLEFSTSRAWKVISNATNSLGQPTGFALVAGENGLAYQAPGSRLRRRAGYVDAHLWVTPYAPREMYAAGDYVYQSPGDDGLPTWTRANRPIENTDVVLWYTLGVTHNPRPEDWPVMPVHKTGFKLVPVGFFSQNPALDVPRGQ